MMKNFVWWLNRKDRRRPQHLPGRIPGPGQHRRLRPKRAVAYRRPPRPGRRDGVDGAVHPEHDADQPGAVPRGPRLSGTGVWLCSRTSVWIAAATNHVGPDGVSLWDDEDGFFYDVLRRPDGSSVPLKVRSIVGLMPLAAATVIPASVRTEFPQLVERAAEFLYRHPAVMEAMFGHGEQIHATGPVLFALFDEARLRRMLSRMLDEDEFLGPHGIRSVSRWHLEHPYRFSLDGHDYTVGYLPAESDTGMFGGNSNWRGPVWFPINIILLRALLNIYAYVGDGFKVECPTGSGRLMNLYEVALEISSRLTRIFLRGADERRPVHGGQPILQRDPHWRDLLLFYEYFHGDNGAGIGASHQTGWTGTVALLPLLARGFSSAGVATGGLGQIVGMATRVGEALAP